MPRQWRCPVCGSPLLHRAAWVSGGGGPSAHRVPGLALGDCRGPALSWRAMPLEVTRRGRGAGLRGTAAAAWVGKRCSRARPSSELPGPSLAGRHRHHEEAIQPRSTLPTRLWAGECADPGRQGARRVGTGGAPGGDRRTPAGGRSRRRGWAEARQGRLLSGPRAPVPCCRPAQSTGSDPGAAPRRGLEPSSEPPPEPPGAGGVGRPPETVPRAGSRRPLSRPCLASPWGDWTRAFPCPPPGFALGENSGNRCA